MGGYYPTSSTSTAASRAATGLSSGAEFSGLLSQPFVPSKGNVSGFEQYLKNTVFSPSKGNVPSFGTPPTPMGRYALLTGSGFPSMLGPSMRLPPTVPGAMGMPVGALAGIAGRALARLMPWMGAALAAYDMYQQWAEEDKELGPFPEWANRNWVHPPEATIFTQCGSEVYGPMMFGNATCGATVGYCCSPRPGEQPPPPGDLHYGIRREASQPLLFSYWMVEWKNSTGAEPNVAQNYFLNVRYTGSSDRADEDLWPKRQAGMAGGPAPLVHPNVDPNSAPVSGPEPRPAPLPQSVLHLRQPNPWRVREEAPDRGYENPPGAVPPSEPPVLEPPPVEWPPRPPRPREKERKFKARGKLGQALAAAFFLTEVDDLVDAFYEALPDHLNSAEGTIDKALAIYRHWDEVDMAEALVNVWANAVEDALIGYAQGYQTKASAALSALLPGSASGIHPGRGLL